MYLYLRIIQQLTKIIIISGWGCWSLGVVILGGEGVGKSHVSLTLVFTGVVGGHFVKALVIFGMWGLGGTMSSGSCCYAVVVLLVNRGFYMIF